MKKLILSSLITLILLTGSSWLNVVSPACVIASISCGDGTGTTLSTCGTSSEIAEDIKIVTDALCD